MPGKGSPEFIKLMNDCIEIHYKKNHDYASSDNPLQNFERAAIIVSWFTNPNDQVFATLVGIKIARLAELLNTQSTPKNESTDDSFMDGTNYFGLWGAYRIKSRKTEQFQEKYEQGRSMTIPIDYTQPVVTQLPIICSQCEIMTKEGTPFQIINHAVTMHSAIYNNVQQTLKYPGKEIVLLTHKFFDRIPTHE